MTESLTRSPIVVTHEKGLSFAAEIREHRLITDQPSRAGGDDAAPSPTELIGAALGSCAALYVQQFCLSRGVPHEGMRIEVTSRHVANPSRIGEFSVAVFLPGRVSAHTTEMIERVVRSCPVHNTLVHGAAVSVSIDVGVTTVV